MYSTLPPAARYDEAMRNGLWLTIGLSVLALCLVTTLYVGAYFAAVETSGRISVDNVTGEVRETVRYRFGGQSAEVIFVPAHAIDRILRRDKWQWNFREHPERLGK